MGFQDYSGQVVLDMVLTDEGRARLARMDGSFKVAGFSCGDSVIDYRLFDPNNPGGEAYYDAAILATPVMEAITDNGAVMTSRLISINKTNLFYLPILKLNSIFDNAAQQNPSIGMHVVCVDQATEDEFIRDSAGNTNLGMMMGVSITSGSYLRIDQGLDSPDISPQNLLDSELMETQYSVLIDNRFGVICSRAGLQASPTTVDDDQVAAYSFTRGANPDYVQKNSVMLQNTATQVIRGPRGTYTEFKIKASIELNANTYLFNKFGTTALTTAAFQGVSGIGISYQFIDAVVKVLGGTTGNVINVPVRFIKLV
jgi:hypothetical protein